MNQHKIQKQGSQRMLHTTNSQSSPATTQLSTFGCLKGGEWKGKREEGNKGARQHNTSHSETPPCPQQEQEGICHQVWLGEVQDTHSSCQPQQSPPKNQIIPCQGKVFCSHTMQQHGLGGRFFPLLWENIIDFKTTSFCRTPDGTLAGDEGETGNLQVTPLPSKQWDVMRDMLGEGSMQAIPCQACTEINACSSSSSVKLKGLKKIN